MAFLLSQEKYFLYVHETVFPLISFNESDEKGMFIVNTIIPSKNAVSFGDFGILVVLY